MLRIRELWRSEIKCTKRIIYFNIIKALVQTKSRWVSRKSYIFTWLLLSCDTYKNRVWYYNDNRVCQHERFDVATKEVICKWRQVYFGVWCIVWIVSRGSGISRSKALASSIEVVFPLRLPRHFMRLDGCTSRFSHILMVLHTLYIIEYLFRVDKTHRGNWRVIREAGKLFLAYTSQENMRFARMYLICSIHMCNCLAIIVL